jgi:hypothetical protein
MRNYIINEFSLLLTRYYFFRQSQGFLNEKTNLGHMKNK